MTTYPHWQSIHNLGTEDRYTYLSLDSLDQDWPELKALPSLEKDLITVGGVYRHRRTGETITLLNTDDKFTWEVLDNKDNKQKMMEKPLFRTRYVPLDWPVEANVDPRL